MNQWRVIVSPSKAPGRWRSCVYLGEEWDAPSKTGQTRRRRGARAEDDQQDTGHELVEPSSVVGGVAEQPRADNQPGAAEQRDQRRRAKVSDEQPQRPEPEHHRHVVGHRRVASRKVPHPGRYGDPEHYRSGGERAAVVDPWLPDSSHSVTSKSGRANSVKSRYMAGITSSRTTPDEIATAASAVCRAADVWIVSREPISRGAWISNQPQSTAAAARSPAPRASG